MAGGLGVVGRDPSDDEIVLGVLDAVEQDPALTQRSIARELGIALGLANAYLRRCVHKGYIKVGQVPRRRYAYYLTPQGFAEKSRLTASYLSHSFSFFRRAREQFAVIFAAAAADQQTRVLLLGAGDLADIARLVVPEHGVEIVGVCPEVADEAELTTALSSFGRVDAVIVTALERSQEIFDIARAVLPSGRVYAPDLLRLRVPKADPDQE